MILKYPPLDQEVDQEVTGINFYDSVGAKQSVILAPCYWDWKSDFLVCKLALKSRLSSIHILNQKESHTDKA